MTTALYRRYRPETFAEMIGQSQVTDPLMTALRSDRIGHAYLFSGPRGCGKTTSARILARCLNCAQGPTDTPCGTCESCVELSRGGGGSLDVIEMDAASNGGVDDARDLRERALFAPARDRYKVFIIDEAHMVTHQGFNALLKLVEEPPDHVKFIFATTEPDKVIGTIRSRTHHYPFRLVPPAAMLGYLDQLVAQEAVEPDGGVLPLVVRAGAGSPRDTLSILDQLIAGSEGNTVSYERAVALLGYTHAELLDEVVDAFAAGEPGGAFAAVDRVVQTGQDPRRFVDDLLERMRDLIVIAATGDQASSVLRGLPADELDRMQAQAAAYGSARLSRAADLISRALDQMTGATSPRLQLELMVARVLTADAEASGAADTAVPAAASGGGAGAAGSASGGGAAPGASAGAATPGAAPAGASTPADAYADTTQRSGGATAPPAAAPGIVPSEPAASGDAAAPPAAPPTDAAPPAAAPGVVPSEPAAAPGDTTANQVAPPTDSGAPPAAAAPGAVPTEPVATSGDAAVPGVAPSERAAAPTVAPPTPSTEDPTGPPAGADERAEVGPPAGNADAGGMTAEQEPPPATTPAPPSGPPESDEVPGAAWATATPGQGSATSAPADPDATDPRDGPAAPPVDPAAPADLSLAALQAVWPQVVGAVEQANRESWLVLQAASPVHLADGVVGLTFTNQADLGRFKTRAPDGSGVSADLRTAIESVTGVRVKFLAKYIPGDGGAPAGPPAAPDSPPDNATGPTPDAGPGGGVAAPSGASDPGASAPGASDPGGSGPGASDPGASDPGASAPGASGPGASASPSSDPRGGGPAAAAAQTSAYAAASGWAVAPIPGQAGDAPAAAAPPPHAGQTALAVDPDPGEAAVPVDPGPARDGDVLDDDVPPGPDDAHDGAPDERAAPAPRLQSRQVQLDEGVQRYGEAVVRQKLGATFLHEEEYEPPTRFQ